MNVIQKYLNKQKEIPSDDGLRSNAYDFVVVIPSYKEKKLIDTLKSLESCIQVQKKILVLIVLNFKTNDAEAISQYHINQQIAIRKWIIQENHHLDYSVILKSFNSSKSGVGRVRKYGMDLALNILTFGGTKEQGVIISLDADSTVKQNYFVEISNAYKKQSEIGAFSIHFEHDLSLCETAEQKEAIMLYELHLRYFINAQKWVGLPYAFQTIGSAFTVSAKAYAAQGGMVSNSAGEDFYFLHKFSSVGKLGNIVNTTVFPSSRSSDRVPFGTGRAVSDMLLKNKSWDTYSFRSFQLLRQAFFQMDLLVKEPVAGAFLNAIPFEVSSFFKEVDFENAVLEIKRNTRSEAQFIKRFYRWFNAFRLMKYCHYIRDQFYTNQEVLTASRHLLRALKFNYEDTMNLEDCLKIYRSMDKKIV